MLPYGKPMNMRKPLQIVVVACLVGVTVGPTLGAELPGPFQKGDFVLLTLQTGKSLTGTVHAISSESVTLIVPPGLRVTLPSARVQKIEKAQESPPTPTPTATAVPTPRRVEKPTPRAVRSDPARPVKRHRGPIVDVKSLREMKRAYKRGAKRVRYEGKVLELMPDGLYYANLDAYDREMHESHKHLVANTPIHTPTETVKTAKTAKIAKPLPVAKNWAELKALQKEEAPRVVFWGSVAFRMPDGLYYWCREDYELVALDRQLKWLTDYKKRRNERLEAEIEAERERLKKGRDEKSPESGSPASATTETPR